MKVSSSFAILDVKRGRDELNRACTNGEAFEVVIRGTLRDVWGDDDGTSREFSVSVEDVKLTRKVKS